MRKNKRTVELPVAEKQIVYERIKEGLAVASQLIIAAPVKLPPKVVMVARYVALALGTCRHRRGGEFRCKLGAAKVAKKAVVLAGAYIGAPVWQPTSK